MAETGVVVLVHGSRGKRGKVEVEEALEKIVASLKPYLESATEIVGAALQFNSPSLEQAVQDLASRRINRIVIVPYFLFSGRHLTEHVPQVLADLQVTYPEISFQVADNLGLDDYFVDLLAKRIRQVAPDLARRAVSSRGRAIESESMQIVENSVNFAPGLSPEEMTVVKRIVHASGDIDIARSIKFSSSGVSSGIGAIAAGRPIVADVRMLATAIDSHLADILGCPVYCALDTARTIDGLDEINLTRSAAAMHRLGTKLDGAIVAIGNAPTALLTLLELSTGGKVRPALIIGMPVGFVRAEESKQELMQCDIPYITVTGTRGGSAMAVATVNALLRIVSDQRLHGEGLKEDENLTC